MFVLGLIAVIAHVTCVQRHVDGGQIYSRSFLVLGSAVLPFLPVDGLYLPELWAGIFLLLSVLAYSVGAIRLAVCCAVAAACARELAMPYVLVSLALAVRERRTQEIRWYAAGLAIFAAYYVAHVAVARTHIQPGDMSHTYSWVAFGGWPFVVSTTALGGWHILFPRWTGAIGAVLVVASLWSSADRHLKIMAVIVSFTLLRSRSGVQQFMGPSHRTCVGAGDRLRRAWPAAAREIGSAARDVVESYEQPHRLRVSRRHPL